MSSLERRSSADHHAEDPSRRGLSRATHADSAGAPWGDGSPSSGAFDDDHAHPRDLDGTDAPTSDVSANWCAQPPCTEHAASRETICHGVGNLSAHNLSPKWTRSPRCPRCKADVSPDVAVAGQTTDQPCKRSLRERKQPAPAETTLTAMPQPKISSLQLKREQMHAMAAELGFFCTPATSYLKDLAGTIASSIRPRSGKAVYQSVAITLPNVPLGFCHQAFAFATQEPETKPGTTKWTIPGMDQTLQVFGYIFGVATPSCSGASKALKSPSEFVVRVIGTIMPGAIMSHVQYPRGVTKLHVQFMYTLADESGELHPPKDSNRNEIELSWEECRELRVQVLSEHQCRRAK